MDLIKPDLKTTIQVKKVNQNNLFKDKIKVVSGAQFNKEFGHNQLVKLVNDTLCHDKIQYQMGFNRINQFNPTKRDGRGLICCFYKDFPVFIMIKSNMFTHMCDVQIPSDAQVTYVKNRNIVVCNKIILTNKQPISNENHYYYFLNHGSVMPRFIPKYFLTTMLSEMIVFLNYIHLAIIPDECKSRKMCLYAVSQKPTLICFVPLRFIDKKFCDELVKKTKTLFGIPIKYIDKEMSLSVVRHDGTELRNVPEKLKLRHFEICEVAFSQCKLSLMYIPKEYHSDIAYLCKTCQRT